MAINETAKGLWDKALDHLESAETVEDAPSSMVYTALGQLSLDLARFAVENHALVMGIDPYGPPVSGETPSGTPGGFRGGPTEGPKLWGAPTP